MILPLEWVKYGHKEDIMVFLENDVFKSVDKREINLAMKDFVTNWNTIFEIGLVFKYDLSCL